MSSEQHKLEVLVVGSGIAGPCFAFWLNKFLPSADITILERFAEPRIGGQAVDLRLASVPIVDRMGLLDTVREKTTTEAGIEFIYADGKTKASFPATGDAEAQSGTSEFEILRGDLAKIFYNATKDLPNVKYVFDETIATIEQAESGGKVDVTFANKLPPTSFDVVVGADGMMSRTRRSVFGSGPNNNEYLNRLGQYGSYFTIAREEQDTNFAQWWNAPRGRLIFKRPDQYGTMQIFMAVTDANLERFSELDEKLRERSVEEQKAWYEKEFSECGGWQCERVIKGLRESKDFYMQQIAQVKMDKWYKGRVALVGDAGFCPSPISGVGTGAAIVGSYVLAGEISKSPDDIPAALQCYDATLRPFVEKVQKLVPGAPQVVNPQTEFGISLFNHTMGIASHPFMRQFGGLVGKVIPAFGKNDWQIPEYGGATA